MESYEVRAFIDSLESTENPSKSYVPRATVVPLPIALETSEQLKIVVCTLEF